jgi:hypothetical protein
MLWLLMFLPLCWASSSDSETDLNILWMALIGVGFVTIIGLIALASAWISRPHRSSAAVPLKAVLV